MRFAALMVVLSAGGGGAAPGADPWADTVVDASPGFTGSGLYNDPVALLGPPSTTFYDAFAGEQFITSLVAGPFNRSAPAGEKLVTTIQTGQFIKVRFDEPVVDDPLNRYGIDLLVFGNAFFSASGPVDPDTDMATLRLTNPVGLNAEPVTVAVSMSGIGDPVSHPEEWYVYAGGPFADGLFPTNAHVWDRAISDWGEPSNFTKPVDPRLKVQDFNGMFAADAMDRYGRSGGGTGFDLAVSDFDSIQYVYLTGAGGEVDALADVSPDVSWQQFHGGVAHAGVWLGEVRRMATVLAWSAGQGLVRASQPVVSADGRRVFVLGAGAIRAYDGLTGNDLWAANVHDGSVFGSASSPVYCEGYVYFAGGLNGEATVYKINAANGSTSAPEGGWERALDPADAIVNASVTVVGETLYIHTDGGFAPSGSRLYAINVSDGGNRWVADDGGRGSAAVAYDAERRLIYDLVYVEGRDTVRAYDPDSGAEVWTWAGGTTHPPFPFGVALADDAIWFCDYDFSGPGSVYALEAGGQGALRWSAPTPQSGDACITVDPQGNSYTMGDFSGPGQTRAYDAAGNIRWTFDQAGGWQGSAAWADDVVFVGDQTANWLYMLNAGGNVLRRLAGSGPAAFGEDRLFSVGVDGILYAYELKPLGDLDGDGDVDGDDYALFQDCWTGPGGGPVTPECAVADGDSDEDVDLIDFAWFQTVFTGGSGS